MESIPGGTVVRNFCLQCRRHERLRFDPWVGKIPWRRKCPPTPVFLPGQSHGQRSLVGYSPWGRQESDMTEGLHNNNIQRQKGFKNLEVREYRNASLRSRIEKYWVLPGTWVRRAYGFVTNGWIGMTASFTTYKSWANQSCLWAFWMGRIRVIQEDWQGLVSPYFRNLVSRSWIPLRASGFKGYYLL